MKLDMPKAVLCGLAMIAAAIYFGPGSDNATASDGVQKIAICDTYGDRCADILQSRSGKSGIFGIVSR